MLMERKIPLLRPYFDDDELAEVKKALDSGWVAQGPKTKEFEQGAAEKLGVEHCVAVSNCTAALHLALLSVGVGPGDEVLVGDYTYPATGHSALFCGAEPVFIDVDSGTYNMDPALMKEAITDKTKAIIPIHTFGQIAEMDPIMKIAKDHNLPVIEDAACAFGASYKGTMAGAIGDIGCFSLHARKGITTGEGGLVSTHSKDLADSIRKKTVFGISSAWDREKQDEINIPIFDELGYNYKMSDITAAVGVAQLRKVEKIIARKRELAAYWNSKLEDIEGITAPYEDENKTHIYQSYITLVDEGINRNKLIFELSQRGVQCQIGTYASHIQPVYGNKYECPVSLDIFNRALALPMFYLLNESDIDFAADVVEKTLRDFS